MKKYAIHPLKWEHPEVQRLIQELDRELYEKYPAEEVFVVDHSQAAGKELIYQVAFDGETAIGCGTIQVWQPGEVELKRFYVAPAYRNQGVAARILKMLENEAREQGKHTIKLETGDQQTEAIGFYEKHGFQPIERFGAYADCPSSVCFQKRLR
ncbi:GNAT family N-acetyltransferase [Marinicrinis sediminis]|uniref:GNAT family N-acetyltransferase n=1 Tax=Marinicrinis sediminis TaxID=1652465 RepID=A0ABW5REZ9_9BACL